MPAPQVTVLDEAPAPFTLEIAPGLFTERTGRGSLSRWKDGDKVRFHNGLPQNIGGFVKQTIVGTILGKARRVHEWQSLDRQNWIAIGTSSKLYLLNQGVLYDITPLRRQISRSNPFTTTNGSAEVVVSDSGHDVIRGDYVTYQGATAVAGLDMNGSFQVIDVIDSVQYVVQANGVANASTTGGGSVVMLYDINNGGEDSGLWYGWGVCTWGGSTWGTPRGDCSTMKRALRVWSLDNWGEDLIASPSEGAVYYWDRTLGPFSRAVLVPQAPSTNQRILVSPENRQLICLGANSGSGPDPLRIRVSDNENFTQFTSGVGNVFTKRIDSGSKIITGFRTRSGTLIFTDLSIHLMQPTGDTLVYSVRQLAEGNSIIGPNAGIEVDGISYWMSQKRFMVFDGVVQEMPCEVWSKIFGDQAGEGINPDQSDKVYCFYNDAFGEIWWFYPSFASTENDRYVMYKPLDRTWSYGSIARTAGNRKSSYYGFPYAIDTLGNFFTMEDGLDDYDPVEDVPIPMVTFLESYDIQISSSAISMHASKMEPDNEVLVGDLNVFLKTKRRANQSAYVTKGPYLVQAGRETVGVRAKGRYVAIRFESGNIGAEPASAEWKLGSYSLYVIPDGER